VHINAGLNNSSVFFKLFNYNQSKIEEINFNNTNKDPKKIIRNLLEYFDWEDKLHNNEDISLNEISSMGIQRIDISKESRSILTQVQCFAL
jgi:hypothetical protein